MSEAVEKLIPLLNALTREERADVLDYLRDLDGGEDELTSEEWEAHWAEECNRRIAEMDSGAVKGIPSEDVFRRIDEKLRQMRKTAS